LEMRDGHVRFGHLDATSSDGQPSGVELELAVVVGSGAAISVTFRARPG
jgi:hypothetical protein